MTGAVDDSTRPPASVSPPRSSGSGWLRVRPAPFVAAVVVGLVGLQLAASWSLLHRPINVDESFTVLTVRGGLSSLVSGVRADPGMAGYYVPLWLIRHLTGSGIVALRTASFVCQAAVIATICVWSNRRGRLLTAVALVVLLGMTPAVRMAAVEARAYALAELASVVAVYAVARDMGGATRRSEWLAAIATGFLALVHPSALGAASFLCLSLAVLARRANRLGLAHAAAALVVGGAGVAGLLQAESSTSAAATGIDGLTFTLASLFGASLVTALAVIVAVTLAVGFDGRRDPVTIIALGAGLSYVALCVVTLPLGDIAPSNPRYWVATAGLIALAGALVGTRSWRRPVLAMAILGALVMTTIRHDAELDRGYAFCSEASLLSSRVAAGDQIIFEPPVVRSMVVACLDPDSAMSLRLRATFVPQTEAADMDDPRRLFLEASGDLTAVTFEPPQQSWIIADEVSKPQIEHLVARMEAAGATCVAATATLIGCTSAD